MAYVFQLVGYDPELRWTREEHLEYPDLPVGEYTFQVQAVDRDLTYSEEPATVLSSLRRYHPRTDRPHRLRSR